MAPMPTKKVPRAPSSADPYRPDGPRSDGGIPTLLLFAFVWVPALASVALAFTTWDGIGWIDSIEWVGIDNYELIFPTTRRSARRAPQHLWLAC